MAKTHEPTIEQLKAQIESLEEDLAYEKKLNRKILDLPQETPSEDIKPPWSTEWMQEQTDAHEVTDGAVTGVYNQRVWKLVRLKNGNVNIRGHNGEQARKNPKYKVTKLDLKAESFFVLLEVMQFAAREFDMNRDEVVARMTDGKGIKVKRAINGF